MTCYKYMLMVARGVADGIAWPVHVFEGRDRSCPYRFDAADLVDKAVDIAWQRLLPKAPPHAELVVEQRDNLLLFRAQPFAPSN